MTNTNLLTTKPEATITMRAEGQWSCRITRNGRFVSGTIHPTEAAAVAYATKRKAVVVA